MAIRVALFFGSLATDELEDVDVAIRLVDDLVAAVALVGTMFISSSLELSSSKWDAVVLVLVALWLRFFGPSGAASVLALGSTAASGFFLGLPLFAVEVVVLVVVGTLDSSFALVVVLRVRVRVALLGGDVGADGSVSIARRAIVPLFTG